MRKLVQIILLSGFLLLVYGQSFRLGFSLLDDGQMVLVKREMVNTIRFGDIGGLVKILFETQIGRVRPVYQILQTTVVLVSNENPYVLHFLRLSLLVVSLILLYRSLRLLNVKSSLAFISLAIIAFNVQNVENYFRLGPQEPWLVLFILLNLTLLLKSPFSRIWTMIILAISSLLASGVKETYLINTFFWWPFAMAFSGQKNKHVYGITASLASLVGGLSIVGIKAFYPVSLTDYSSQYSLNVSLIIQAFTAFSKIIIDYQLPLTLAILGNIFFIFFKSLSEKKPMHTIFHQTSGLLVLFFGFLLNLGILLPWKYVLGRYLLVANIFIVLIFAVSLGLYYSNSLNRYKNIIITLALFWFSVPNVIGIANYQYLQKNDSDLTRTLIDSLDKSLPSNATLLSNYKKGDSNIEIYMETLWHLQLFKSRFDINYSYLDSDNLCALGDRYILDRRSDRFLEKNILASQLESVASYSATLIQINSNQYQKYVLFPRLTPEWETKDYFDWTLFKQKDNTCIEG